MTYLVFDTETTGTHSLAEIVQFAMQLYSDDNRCIGEFSSLIKPEDWIIPEDTQKFHTENGSFISQENCDKFGLTIKSVLFLFFNWANKSDRIVAHNAQFDFDRVIYSCRRIGLEMPRIKDKIYCTAEASTNILQIPPTQRMIDYGHGKEFKKPKLIEAYRHFYGVDFEDAHDALADVRACAKVFMKLTEKKE